MFEQDGNFFFAVAQRRQMQRERVQPVVKIFAQTFGRQRFGNIDVGCRENANVDFDHRAAAQSRERLILQYVQQLGLQERRHLADFIQKNRSLVAEFEFSRLGVRGTGECSRLVAEELAFQ